MLCDRVWFVAGEDDATQSDLDFVDITWAECGRRVLRTTSHAGRRVRVLLPLGVGLRHGDVLGDAAGPRVVVNVGPCDVLVVRPRDAREAARVGLELGNLHAPAQIGEGEILVLPDGPVEAALWQLGVSYSADVRRFAPEAVTVAPAFRAAPAVSVTAARASPAGPTPSAAAGAVRIG